MCKSQNQIQLHPSNHIINAINNIKSEIENAILTASYQGVTYSDGQKAKEALIRSSTLINNIHEAIKLELIDNGIDQSLLIPPLGCTSPEFNMAGFLKKKNQDVCVIPQKIKKVRRLISWGPLKDIEYDDYGSEFTNNTLTINIRSQLSSLQKNVDTLFERTFAEAMNLHLLYPNLVLGEVYLIPLYEYDDALMKNNQVGFKNTKTNIVKFIRFFSALNGRVNSKDDQYKYEKCALIIVDFNKTPAKIYSSQNQLIADKIINGDSNIDFDSISIGRFTREIVDIYKKRTR